MPTIVDRLLGRTQPAEKAVVTGNGGTGPGVLAYYNDAPLWTAAKNPRRLMRQAQELYHTHDVVHQVEQRISSTAAGVKWHLEDENDEEINDESPPELQAIRDLLEYPQALIPAKIRKQTRRSLWQLTLRHGGLCGTGFWFPDERDGLYGIPRSFLYINPARMLAQYDKAGNTVAWLLDADDEGNGGYRLEIDEVYQYEYDPPDIGAYPIGIVESAGTKAHLNALATRHESSVLSAGGRLTGLFTPKTGEVTLSPDAKASFVRDWRNIAEDPQAAKRAQILDQPIEHIRTSATPQELQIVEVWRMSREDIYANWGLPQSQQGITQSQGLNSGDTKGYDEAILWQGPVHARLDPFREMVQGFLDDVKRRGGPAVTLVLEEPEFDDETPLYDRAQKAIDQPLTDNQRLAILGLDPLPDFDAEGKPLGLAIWRSSGLTLVASAPDDGGKFGTMPVPPPPPPNPFGPPNAPPQPNQPPNQPQPPPAVKASLAGMRKSIDRVEPAVRQAVAEFLANQREQIVARIRKNGDKLARKPTDLSIWWNEALADAKLEATLAPHATRLAETVVGKTKQALGKADVFAESVSERVAKHVGERVTGINQTTRDAIASLISQGFDDGLSPSEVADLISGATTFDAARAELIARTETALVYNQSALLSFGEFGVSEVQAIDGDADAECAARDGQVYPIAEALAIEDHPNGTLDWAPVI